MGYGLLILVLLDSLSESKSFIHSFLSLLLCKNHLYIYYSVCCEAKGLKEMDGSVSVFSVRKAIYRHYFKLYWTWQKQHPRVIWHYTKYFLRKSINIFIWELLTSSKFPALSNSWICFVSPDWGFNMCHFYSLSIFFLC